MVSNVTTTETQKDETTKLGASVLQALHVEYAFLDFYLVLTGLVF
jgi:hypothetical protein